MPDSAVLTDQDVQQMGDSAQPVLTDAHVAATNAPAPLSDADVQKLGPQATPVLNDNDIAKLNPPTPQQSNITPNGMPMGDDLRSLLAQSAYESPGMSPGFGDRFNAFQQSFVKGLTGIPEKNATLTDTHPVVSAIANGLGQLIGLGAVGSGVAKLTAGALADQLGKASPELIPWIMNATRIGNTAATFGVKQASDVAIKSGVTGQQPTMQDTAEVFKQAGMGALFGGAGSIPGRIPSTAAVMGLGFALSKIQGASDPSALAQGVAIGLFHVIGNADLDAEYKKMAISKVTDAAAQNIQQNYQMSPQDAQNVTKQFIYGQAMAKTGTTDPNDALDTLVKDPHLTMDTLEDIYQSIKNLPPKVGIAGPQPELPGGQPQEGPNGPASPSSSSQPAQANNIPPANTADQSDQIAKRATATGNIGEPDKPASISFAKSDGASPIDVTSENVRNFSVPEQAINFANNLMPSEGRVERIGYDDASKQWLVQTQPPNPDPAANHQQVMQDAQDAVMAGRAKPSDIVNGLTLAKMEIDAPIPPNAPLQKFDTFEQLQAYVKTNPSVSRVSMDESGKFVALNPSSVSRETALTGPVYHGTMQKFDKFDPKFLGSNTGAESAKQGFFFSPDKEVAQSYVSKRSRGGSKLALKLIDNNVKIKELTGDTWPIATHKMVQEELYKRPSGYSPDIIKKLNTLLNQRQSMEDAAEKLQDTYFNDSQEIAKGGNVLERYLDMKNPMVVDMKGEGSRSETYAEIIKRAKAAGHDSVTIKNTFDAADAIGNAAPHDVHVVFNPEQILTKEDLENKPDSNGLTMQDRKDLANLEDWASYQQPGGELYGETESGGKMRTKSGYPAAVQNVGPKRSFEILKKVADGQKLTSEMIRDAKILLDDYVKNLKEGIDGQSKALSKSEATEAIRAGEKDGNSQSALWETPKVPTTVAREVSTPPTTKIETKSALSLVPKISKDGINIKFNFPLPKHNIDYLTKAANDSDLAEIAKNVGLKNITIEPPNHFTHLSETGHFVPSTGEIKLNPNSPNIVETFYHELAHRVYDNMTDEQKKKVNSLVNKNQAVIKKSSPGYVGNIDESFSELLAQKNSEAINLAKQVKSQEGKYKKVEDKISPPNIQNKKPIPYPPKGMDAYLNTSSDIDSFIKDHGDHLVVVKDVNGGKHVISMNDFQKWIKNPLITGHIKEAWVTNTKSNKELKKLDGYTLSGLPLMVKGIGQSTPSLANNVKDDGDNISLKILSEEHPNFNKQISSESGHILLPAVDEIAKALKESINILNPRAFVPRASLDMMMKMKGERDIKEFQLEQRLQKISDWMDKWPKEKQIAFVDKIKLGQPQGDPRLDKLVEMMRDVENQYWAAVHQYNPSLAYKDNHFRVLWKVVPGSSATQKGSFSGMFRRPLQGTKGYMKQATLNDMSEGIAKGGVPYSYNPMVMWQNSMMDMQKFITAQQMWAEGKNLGAIKFIKIGEHAPDGYTRVNDSIARIYFSTDAGLVNAGEYHVEENFGRILNNFLSKDYIRDSAIGANLLKFKNITTAIELSLSPFHFSFESIESIASKIGLGLQKAYNIGFAQMNGAKFLEGLKDIATSPTAPAQFAMTGGKVIRLAGDYQGSFLNTAEGQSFLKQFPDAQQLLVDAFQGGMKMAMHQDYKINSLKAFQEGIKNKEPWAVMWSAIPAVNETVMKPLFEVYIPRLKLGVFFHEMSNELQQRQIELSNGRLTRTQLARQVVDSVENRFGEMNFDNLFWNRTFKSTMQLLFRSVTWKLGSLRNIGTAIPGQITEIVNAINDRRVPLLHRNMAWLMGICALVAAFSEVTMQAYLHERPRDLRDFVAPRYNKNGDRISLNTYMKDILHLIHSPFKYLTSSMSGEIGRMVDLWNNKDFYNREIIHPGDNALQKFGEAAKYLFPTPFVASNTNQAKTKGAPPEIQAGVMAGAIQPAPAYISQSPALQLAYQLKDGNFPQTARTQAEFEKSQLKSQLLVAAQKKGPTVIDDAVANKQISYRTGENLKKEIDMTPLQRAVITGGPYAMNFNQVFQVAQKADAGEIKQIMPTLQKLYFRALDNTSGEERKQLISSYTDFLKSHKMNQAPQEE